jgi:shikimate dehydrogenase
MIPYPEASPWPEGVPLPAGAALYDLIYKPLETKLMRQAQASGLAAFNGLGMLVEQAALAFERWTGAAADRAAMWRAVSSGPDRTGGPEPTSAV